jgi:hypothetical protein
MPAASATSTIATTFDALLATGELVDEASFCDQYGLTPLQLKTAIAAGRLFRLEVGQARGYPAFFLDHTLDRIEVEAVSALLGECAAGTKLAFFTTPRGSLATPGPIADGVLAGSGTPRTPIQALRDGHFDLVKRLALSSNGR